MKTPVERVVAAPIEDHSIFLEGPAGAGKSQLLIKRLQYLLEQGVAGYSILVLLPDRLNIRHYKARLARLDLGPFSAVEFHTYYSLATQLVRQFWPLVAGDAGFARPQRPPTYLTYETAQYVMLQIIEPRLEAGYFEGLSMRKQRIVSQLIDNLNKAAINGYAIAEVRKRLRSAWSGEVQRMRAYDQAQECIRSYRTYCLEHGLLDISLAVEVFHNHLVNSVPGQEPTFWRYFTERYAHLLVDNVEETVPVAQDLIGRLLPGCDSALLVYDAGGGYRIFLGVDPEGALALRERCQEVVTLAESTSATPAMIGFATRVGRRLGQTPARRVPADSSSGDAIADAPDAIESADEDYASTPEGRVQPRSTSRDQDKRGPPSSTTTDTSSVAHKGDREAPEGRASVIAGMIRTRYRAEMIKEVVAEVESLVAGGVAPGDIALVAPYVDGVLRFTLAERMQEAGIPFRVIRRHESLREKPIVRASLTLASLAHPQWAITPAPFDVAEALSRTIPRTAGVPLGVAGMDSRECLDPVRAALITRKLYDQTEPVLRPREHLSMTDHERIGFAVLERYEEIRSWIEAYKAEAPEALDHFLSRLFGELLSRPDFGHEEAATYEKLIASAKRFRTAAPAMGIEPAMIGHHYVQMANEGIVAAQYTVDVPREPQGATLAAPIYTYLLGGQSSCFQFWLDVGSISWWEPPHQPLTNPHVLARRWPADARWTDEVDYITRNRTLYRLVKGLTQRCRAGIYLCFSELEVTGEPRVVHRPLLRAIQAMVREGERV